MADMRLSPADQVLINAAMCLVLPIVRPDPDDRMVREVIEEVIGKGNPDNPLMRPVIDALRVLIDAPSGDARLKSAEKFAYQSAMWDLQRALHQVARWRMGAALDAHRAKHGEAA
jgi:hypothetical protein